MKASTAVALGVGALVIAGGTTAAFMYLKQTAPPPAVKVPTATVDRITIPDPTVIAKQTQNQPAPGPGATPAPQQTDAQRVAGDVKAYADAAKSVANVVGDVATQLKGFFA